MPELPDLSDLDVLRFEAFLRHIREEFPGSTGLLRARLDGVPIGLIVAIPDQASVEPYRPPDTDGPMLIPMAVLVDEALVDRLSFEELGVVIDNPFYIPPEER